MPFFEVYRHDAETGNRVMGLIEAPNNFAALRRLRDAGLRTETTGNPPVCYSVSAIRGGFPTVADAHDSARRYNAALRVQHARDFPRLNGPDGSSLLCEDSLVLTDADLEAIA